MIKAIFFDAVGTLIYLPKGVGFHYREVAKRHGLNVDEKKLNAAFRRVWKDMPSRPATRAPRPDDDKGWWRVLVGRVLDICEVECSEADGYFEELYAHFARPGVWELYPEVEDVLEQLGKNHTLGIISNFDSRLRVILDHLGIAQRFRTIAISSETGADKPDAFIFEKALQTIGVNPHESLHVGDDPIHDLQGAQAAGMHCFHLQRPGNSLSDLFEYLRTHGS